MKLCQNCKHFVNDGKSSVEFGRCALTAKIIPEYINPVNGKIIIITKDLDYASLERKNGKCSTDAILYEYEDNIYKRFINSNNQTITLTLEFSKILSIYITLYIIFYKI